MKRYRQRNHHHHHLAADRSHSDVKGDVREDVSRDLNGRTPPVDSERLPIDPTTGEPIPPRTRVGYYPGFSTLSQQAFWDDATRRVVLDRVNRVPEITFFTPAESRLMQAVVDRILPQDDRDAAHQIPILPYIDERLANDVNDGYRYEHMPPDGEAYRLGLRAIEAIAQHLCAQAFVDLHPDQQDAVLQTLHDGNPPAGEEIWRQLSVRHFWPLLVQDCIGAYYAHPYAWDEIGFGGPAYPRGYMRLEQGRPEPWEVDEQCYDWEPPPRSRSGAYTNLDHQTPFEQQFGVPIPGQGGTH